MKESCSGYLDPATQIGHGLLFTHRYRSLPAREHKKRGDPEKTGDLGVSPGVNGRGYGRRFDPAISLRLVAKPGAVEREDRSRRYR